tara:strand:+ start:35 stop:223 length:189 start_codon:yes stop_codon:yes gene_type:complete
MNKEEKIEMIKFIVKINLMVGLYNLYLYAFSGSLFNFIIGSMNIGVWVFFRDIKFVKFIINK